ncbi:methyltransferase-like protein 7B [Trichonephila inaurata madagascariensis]|uniref:Methyltransferase-like protein 7B n=1 Tax=Trichonephila inaurata madagascariensis TaxID=2747483 RepID=A0A8X6XS41_9ARAC|nr:methyltransferase-like protein 7B [Trichonephila inaurata madagascariensis]
MKNRNKYPQVSYRRTVIQPAECMKGVDDNSVDVVVSTFLHCSCDDSAAVSREVKRVLKPGGKYLFLDHTGFPEGDIGLHIQRFFNPLWSLIFDGCYLDRNPSRIIKEAGFSDVQFEKHISRSFWMYLLRHMVMGIATK